MSVTLFSCSAYTCLISIEKKNTIDSASKISIYEWHWWHDRSSGTETQKHEWVEMTSKNRQNRRPSRRTNAYASSCMPQLLNLLSSLSNLFANQLVFIILWWMKAVHTEMRISYLICSSNATRWFRIVIDLVQLQSI